MKKVLLIAISLFSLATLEAQSIRDLYQEGLKAYEEKDYKLFKEKMFAIDTMRPNYPAVVYNLAGSYALTGELDKSIQTLNKYILMDASPDFSKDADFDAIKETSGFAEIQRLQEKLTKEIPVQNAIEWAILPSHPESITYSKKQNSYFIGGVRDGNIWKIQEGKEPMLWAASESNSWCVMGLEVSEDNKFLWACTAAMENYDGFLQNDEGFSSVLKFDLKSKKCLAKYTLADGHVFGDLISDSQGNIYISDGTANIIYTVNEEKEQLEIFKDLSKTVFNLQGLTLNKDQTSIYISDYIDGIYKLDIDTKKVSKLTIHANQVLLKGIDGLYFDDNSLIGLHNGNTPNRVIKYQLNKSGNAIIGKEIISQAGVLGEPTQGVFVNDQFFYITNSPWGAYDKDGNFNPSAQNLIIGTIN